MIKLIFRHILLMYSLANNLKNKFKNSNRTYDNISRSYIHEMNHIILPKFNIFYKYNPSNPLHYWTGIFIIFALLICTDFTIATQLNWFFKIILQALFCLLIPGIFALGNLCTSLLLLLIVPNKKYMVNVDKNSKTCKTNFMFSMIIMALSLNIIFTGLTYDLYQIMLHPGYNPANLRFLFVAFLFLTCAKYTSIFLKAVNKFKIESFLNQPF